MPSVSGPITRTVTFANEEAALDGAPASSTAESRNQPATNWLHEMSFRILGRIALLGNPSDNRADRTVGTSLVTDQYLDDEHGAWEDEGEEEEESLEA